MPDVQPKILLAGEREAHALCVHCGRELQLGDATALCQACGGVHHLACWQSLGGCGAYECLESGARAARTDLPVLSITAAELAEAVPLPPAPVRSHQVDDAPTERPRNRLAVWSFVIALLGIPLFGLVTGLVAIVVACIALAGHSARRRGLGLAVAAMLIGVFEVIGWAVGLSMYLGGNMGGVSLAELTIDPESLEGLPERIARAMRANVLIQTDLGLGRGGIGSGVILKVRDGLAYIVTNRHVIDAGFHDAPVEDDPDVDEMAPVTVMTVDQSLIPGAIEWVAPNGVDLAIVSVPIGDEADDIREAWWNVADVPHVGDPVFAVGNPHGLGWTHSAGSVSQIRRRTRGVYTFRILQSTAAINPGNSGGGLYDDRGRLIGINTLTGDKRVAEGLGFSIAIPALMELAPERLGLPDVNPEVDADDESDAAAGAAPADENHDENADVPEARDP